MTDIAVSPALIGPHARARAFTTCATASPCARCWAGTARASTSRRGCRCCRPSSATSTRRRRTGTCRPRPSCWRSPPSASAISEHCHERARPDPAGVLHRAAARQRQASPTHGRRLPRHLPAAARASPQQRPASRPAGCDIADLDAPLIAAFLDHLERERGNSVAHPQRPPGRDPLAVPLRRAAAPRARRHDPRVLADPAQALRPRPRHLPHRRRDRRAARRAGPRHLDRPARPRPAAARGPDRAARLRADRPDAAPTSTSATAPTCAAAARAASNAPRRSPGRPRASCATGWPSAPATPDRPAVPDPHAADRSAATPSSGCSPSTSRPPPTACPSLATKHVTPHTLRHTAAMRLLQAGVDISVIALWLGHEQHRDDPDLPARRPRAQGTALARTDPADTTPGRYRPRTRSSPSSKRCDYAEPLTAPTPD